jgi:hypothetical protein
MARIKLVKRPPTPSYQELFEEGDARFLRVLYFCYTDKTFTEFARKWYQDKRPFAREALLQYVDDGCERRGHRLLVKRLFRLAEANQDHHLMGRFLVAFDRLNRRKLIDTIEGKKLIQTRHPHIKTMFTSYDQSRNALCFTRDTRLYLQRRVWRYFRRLASRDELAYWREIKSIIVRYQEHHLSKVEKLLDSWGLLHILYGESRVLHRRSRGVILRPGKTLAELVPSPYCESAWRGKFTELYDLLFTANSKTVRVFLRGLLEREHREELSRLPLSSVRRLLSSSHEDLQQWGVARLRSALYLSELSVSDWISLIQIQNATISSLLISLATEALSKQALSLAQRVSLAALDVEPIAALGFSLCKDYEEQDFVARLPLGNAAVPSIRSEAVSELLVALSSSPEARSEHLRELLDSRYEDTRAAALSLMKNDARYRESVVLWGALAESPYHDVRAYLLTHLESRASLFQSGTLQLIWGSVLLAILKGSRAKQTAIRQLAERLIQRPEEAKELCALLAIALRSVRATERSAAIAVLARAGWSKPSIREAIEVYLPELRLFTPEEAA